MLDSSAPSATAEPHTARGHGPGRPTKPLDVGELARRYARRAVQALVRQLNGSDPMAATRAAEILLSHAFGKPVQHHALYVPRISVECHAADQATDRPNGKDDAQPGRWDA